MSNANVIFSKLLVGTSKVGSDMAFPAGIDEMFPNEDGQPVSLKKIGTLAVWEKAGFMPAKTAKLPEQDSGDTPPIWDDKLLNAVRNAFLFDSDAYRKETFQAIISTQSVLPHELLVDALDFGKRHEPYRNHVCSMLGSRGRWLSEQNEAWQYATGTQSESENDIWNHGNPTQRQALFKKWRSADRNHANEMLLKEFDDIGASERLAFLSLIDESLHPEDEAVLNKFFSVRGKEIRTAAGLSLSKIHTSGLVMKTAEIVNTLLKKEKAILRSKWTIEAPEKFLPEWKSLGIEESKSKDAKIGDRGNLLRQLASILPLTWWENTMEMNPEDLLTWAKKTDWAEPVFTAWTYAFNREPNAVWAKAFLVTPTAWKGNQGKTELLANLPQDEQEYLWLEHLKKDNRHDFGNKLQILCEGFSNTGKKPSFSFSLAVGELVQKFSEQYDYALPKSMLEFVSIASIKAIPAIIELIEKANPAGDAMSNAIVRSLTLMDNRRTIHQYFSQKEQL